MDIWCTFSYINSLENYVDLNLQWLFLTKFLLQLVKTVKYWCGEKNGIISQYQKTNIFSSRNNKSPNKAINKQNSPTKSHRSTTRQSCLQISRFFSNGVRTRFSFSSSLWKKYPNVRPWTGEVMKAHEDNLNNRWKIKFSFYLG